ncbi:MAG: hypothetical protein ABUS57_03105 [Pseudomonadota bacterium]
MSFSWQGLSGRWYDFDVARAKRAWDTLGGVYMFVKSGDYPTMEAGGPIALFVAKTNDFSQALARHEMWQAAQQLGASEIHLLVIESEALRIQVEQDLLKAQTPILNRQMLRRVA